MKEKILTFIGYTVLFTGIFFLVVGFGMLLDETEKPNQGLSIAVFSFSFTIPAAIMIWAGRRERKRREMLESIASIIRSYRRINLATLAGKAGIPIPLAGKLLARAMSRGLVKGKFDRTTDEFFTDDAEAQKLQYRFCPGCGSPLDRVYLEGDTVKCDACGFLMR